MRYLRIFAGLKRDLRTVLVAGAVAGAVAATPAVAATFADFATNSHKVDGKHAVSSSASSSQRARKLVATNGSGKLPNSIIAKAPNADKLDGVNGSAYLKRTYAGSKTGPVTLGTSLAQVAAMDVPAGKYVIFAKLWVEDTSPTFPAPVQCRLIAGADFDETKVYIEPATGVNSRRHSVSLMVTHRFASAGTIDLQCSSDFTNTGQANRIRISAIQMNGLSEKTLP